MKRPCIYDDILEHPVISSSIYHSYKLLGAQLGECLEALQNKEINKMINQPTFPT